MKNYTKGSQFMKTERRRYLELKRCATRFDVRAFQASSAIAFLYDYWLRKESHLLTVVSSSSKAIDAMSVVEAFGDSSRRRVCLDWVNVTLREAKTMGHVDEEMYDVTSTFLNNHRDISGNLHADTFNRFYNHLRDTYPDNYFIIDGKLCLSYAYRYSECFYGPMLIVKPNYPSETVYHFPERFAMRKDGGVNALVNMLGNDPEYRSYILDKLKSCGIRLNGRSL